MTSENKNENKGKKAKRKISLNQVLRKGLIIAALICIAMGGGIFFWRSRPKLEERERELSYYNISANTEYQVHIKENTLIEEDYLSEGRAYPSSLADELLIDFSANFESSTDMDIEGGYKVTAVMEGNQGMGESAKPVYKKEFILFEAEPQSLRGRSMELKRSVGIPVEEYRSRFAEAEQIIGLNLNESFYIIFEPVYIAGGNEEKLFSRVDIVLSGDKLFTVDKTVPENKENRISEKYTERVSPAKAGYMPFAAMAVFGLLLLGVIMTFTKNRSEKENYLAAMSGIIRKYGSRLLCVEGIPAAGDRECVSVLSMDAMVELSEELRAPLIYALDGEGRVEQGSFYIYSGSFVYVYRLPMPAATLVEEDISQSN